MKSGDKLRMMALRSVLSEISRLEKDVRRDPNDAEILQIIKRERAKREESLEFARKAARQDLIDQNETEAKILDSYLPATASADDVRAEIAAAIAAGATQIGPVMKALRDKFGAGVDGKIEPFRVEVSDAVLDDLRARLKLTRFPDEVPDTAWEYGANLGYLKELVEYWRTKYDWRAQERAINRFAHFKANVDGLGVHFIHEK